jgi:lysophospholipase L1-like esterase
VVFKDGDTLVFLGDSITAQCLYTQYLEDFFYTRFPKTRIHFHNAGAMGDRAADSFKRFEADVAAYKPHYVSVLFGMNDGNFTDWQQPNFEVFQKDMTTLCDRIVELGATPIPMTPTTFDSLPNKLNNRVQDPRDKEYNNVLGTYGAWVKEQGKVRKIQVVDLYSPLTAVTNERRRVESDWTMIPDTVHPTATGHAIMAAAFINDTVFCPPVSEILITKKDNQWMATVGNGELSDVQGGETITFTFKAQSLPWVLPPEADEGRKLVPLAFKKPPKLSSERLAVRNLAPGKYELKIDGESVGQWTDAELAAGIDLGENPKTPQYQQALRVALANKRRNAMGEHPMRIDWAQLKAQRSILKQAEEANESAARVEQARKVFERFFEPNQKSISDYVAKSQDIEDEIYRTNTPEPRKYELSPVATVDRK